MIDALPLRWKATRLNDDPPLVDDGCCYDGEAEVGRARLEEQTNPKGWQWSLTATGYGRDRLITSGVEPDREAAKARVEAAYRALVAAHPENRANILAHDRSLATRKWR